MKKIESAGKKFKHKLKNDKKIQKFKKEVKKVEQVLPVVLPIVSPFVPPLASAIPVINRISNLRTNDVIEEGINLLFHK